MKKIILLFLLVFTIKLWAQTDKNVEVTAQFLNHQNNPYLAIILRNKEHWHTYWKNPGDAGTKTSFKFFINDHPFEPTPLEWPTPKRFIEKGDMWAYGYEGTHAYFFKLTEENIHDGNIIKMNVKWLACHNICVPNSEELIGQFEGDEFLLFSRKSFHIEDKQLIAWLDELPQPTKWPFNLDITLSKEKNQDHLWLQLNLGFEKNISTDKNIIYPLPHDLLTFYHEELFRDRKENIYGRYRVDWEGEYAEPAVLIPDDGKLTNPIELQFLFHNPQTGKVELIQKSFKAIHMRGIAAIENFFRFLSPIEIQQNEITTNEQSSGQSPGVSFLYYLLLAFIGGIILNFMPCVLPVISLKLFGLIKKREQKRITVLKHNLAYTTGILATFLLMALTIIGVKSSGINLGWGFQLQSPTFVLIMTVVIFIFALNLFGLFEFGTPGGKILGGVQTQSTIWGDFWSGILATILATPCSAPFLGTALAFALSSNSFSIIMIFSSIGIGLASPFILTGFFPALVAFLPRPGNWMNALKAFLGLALLLTTIWLIDIYLSLANNNFTEILLLLILFFFAIYFAQKITKKRIKKAIAFLIPIILLIKIIIAHNQVVIENDKLDLTWEKWSVAQMEGYKATRNTVFMDFTANWCLTCKVNKKMVLETDAFKILMIDKGIKLLRGDITKRDETIESWLKQQGMGGVPAYFIQTPTGKLINLGETISLEEIKGNIP